MTGAKYSKEHELEKQQAKSLYSEGKAERLEIQQNGPRVSCVIIVKPIVAKTDQV